MALVSGTIYLPGGKTNTVYGADDSTFASQAAALGGSLTAPSAPATTPTPNAGPSTSGSGATGRYPTNYTAPATGQTSTQSPADSAESGYQAETRAEDPQAISDRITAEYAQEVAAIKQQYAGLLATQTDTNKNESGKTRATASAQGELGQDLGNAAEDNQDTTNAAALAKINNDEATALGGIATQESQAIEGEITGEKTTQQTADQNIITYDQKKASDAQAQVQTVAGQYDLAALPQDEYDSLYEASGFSTPDQFNAYYTASRQSALTGGKTIGDATSGVYQQQADGSWKKVIPGTAGTIGDPTSGVWQLQSDGSYKNVIPAAPKIGSIGAGGSYVYDSKTGSISTIKPAAPKIVSSGGVIYSVDQSTGQATQLTNSKSGWETTGSAADNEKAAVISYVNSIPGIDSKATLAKIQSDPTTYYNALAAAAQAGYYTNLNVSSVPGATDNSLIDATDAATNDSIDGNSGSSDNTQ